jgi:precorrin-2 dehydrogenase / sirohydrochlorin ferrochelatase
MGWTPLILDMKDRHVLVVGSGEVGERRALRFLDAEAQVIITGGTVSEKLKSRGALEKPLNHLEKLVNWADLVVVASGDEKLNQKIGEIASGKLLNRADKPGNGNTIVPSSFFIGDVQICIFTQGKSPLMARQLRKKIQKVIKQEDVLQLELQHFTREILKGQLDSQKERREVLYQILNDETIKNLLEEGDLQAAQEKVTSILGIDLKAKSNMSNEEIQ